MDWKPKARILAVSAKREPTKPSKPGSVGFEGAPSAESPEIRDKPAAAELGMPWAEWKAAALNQLFKELGTTGQPGRITAEAVRHGEHHQRHR
jgi:hypothetical protein